MIILTMNFLAVANDPQPHWVNYLLIVTLLPLTLFLSFKTVTRYKIVSMGNGQILIHYPLLRTRKTYSLDQVSSWTEVKVKTGKSVYQELQIRFYDKHSIHLGQQEFTEYSKLLKYLSQKIASLRQQH